MIKILEKPISFHSLVPMMRYTAPALLTLESLMIPLSAVAQRNLPEFSEEQNLETAEIGVNGREHLLHPVAGRAWRRMKAGARSQGLDIYIVSAFRSVERQIGIIKRKLEAGLTIDQIIKVSAPPYFSEHHTGFAVDVGTSGYQDLECSFDETPAFMWLLTNARSFGFEMSYGINNVEGFSYEPWHWRFTRA